MSAGVIKFSYQVMLVYGQIALPAFYPFAGFICKLPWEVLRRLERKIFKQRYNNDRKKHIWAASWQNQHSAFATSMDPDQPAHPHSLIRIHTVRLPTLSQVEKLIANSMDSDQTATVRMRWLRSGSMLVANALCWFCCDAAHV
jgi:hypothetical protein